MKNPLSLILLLLFSLLFFSSAAIAQDTQPPPPDDDRMPPPPGMQGQPRPEDERGEILRQLNLSQEQFQAIRKLLGDNGPKVREAQRDFRDAQDALDEAIYADTVDEALVQNLTRRSAEAQATLMKLRTASEFAIRRVMSPEQVTKFRELRRQQLLRRQERLKMQRQNGDRPNGPNGPDGPNGRPGGRRPPLGQPGQPGMQPPAGQPVNNALPGRQGKRPGF